MHMNAEKKEEIRLSPMAKALTPTNPKSDFMYMLTPSNCLEQKILTEQPLHIDRVTISLQHTFAKCMY